MHLGILQTGRSREDLTARHGTFAAMFEAWLGPHRPGAEFSTFDVHEDRFPGAPSWGPGRWISPTPGTGAKSGS